MSEARYIYIVAQSFYDGINVYGYFTNKDDAQAALLAAKLLFAEETMLKHEYWWYDHQYQSGQSLEVYLADAQSHIEEFGPYIQTVEVDCFENHHRMIDWYKQELEKVKQRYYDARGTPRLPR